MLVKIDAAQLEWRVLAWLSGDKVAIDEINSGMDFHAKNQEGFGLPSRLIAKIYLFRTIFRGNGWSFANDPAFMGVSSDPDFWDDINVKFYSKYKGIDAWHMELARIVARNAPIVSPLGRQWKIPVGNDGKLPWTVFTNHPVQGTGADLMTVARVSLFNRMKKAGMRALLVSTVHDDIKGDVPSDELDEFCKMAVQVFADLPKNVKKLWNIELPIPFPGEVNVGKDLQNMEKYG